MVEPKTRGFTLVELLIVVAIIGLLAAIAVPALNAALQRARQKRTMVELRALATAVSSYATDYPFMPKVGPGDADLLFPYLVPTYVRHLPAYDAWRNPIQYAADGLSYTVLSSGSDGIVQSAPPLGQTHTFADDIIVVNGVFVQWPDGIQTQ